MAAQAAVVQSCDVCDSEDNVRWYCKDCHEVMCESCKSVHLRSRKTKNDDVIPLSQARDIQKIAVVWCDIHSSEEVRYHCQPCDQLICIICLHEKHNEHDWITLEDSRNAANRELEDAKEKLSSRLVSGQRTLDIAREVFEKKAANFDKIEGDINNHTDQIINEVKNLRDEAQRSVSEARQRNLETYKKVTDTIQSEEAKVQSEMVKLTSFHENENPSVVMKSAKIATQALSRLVEMQYTPSSFLAKFKSGDLNRDSLQMMLGTCILSATHATGCVNKSKLKYLSSITVPRKSGFIKTIIPNKDGTFWVSSSKDNYLTQIERDGKVVTTSAKFDGEIKDAVGLNYSVLLTHEGKKTRVIKISPYGAVSTFSKHDPFYTGGLCTTNELDVLVCLKRAENAQIARLSQDAVVKQIIRDETDGMVLFKDPWRITCLHSGDFVVTCGFGGKRIVCIDTNGSRLFEYDKIDGKLIGLGCITKDGYNNIFVTDNSEQRVFGLGQDGSATCLIDQSLGIISPWAVAVPADGQLMIGCDAGKIIFMGY